MATIKGGRTRWAAMTAAVLGVIIVSACTSGQTTSVPYSQIKVCTFPALACNSSHLSLMKTAPTEISTTGDGSATVENLAWLGWGQARAQGTGTLDFNNCSPSCAQGTLTVIPATVTLTGLTPYGNGNEAYADMTVTAPGSPTQQFNNGLVP